MYIFDEASAEMKQNGGDETNMTMWLTDARQSKICPHAASNFHCYRIPTSKGETIAAFFVKMADAKFTILFSHGNATDIGYMRDHLLDLAATLQVNVFAYDYSGYGLSSGQPTVANVFADVEAAFDFMVNQLRIAPDTIIPYGQSLGGGPSTHISAVRPSVAGTILHSTFMSGLRVIRPDVDKTHFFDIFPNVDNMANLKMPVLVMHGTCDIEVPIDHGLALYEACNKIVEPWFVDGAGHNDIELNFRHEYYERLAKFLSFLEKRS